MIAALAACGWSSLWRQQVNEPWKKGEKMDRNLPVAIPRHLEILKSWNYWKKAIGMCTLHANHLLSSLPSCANGLFSISCPDFNMDHVMTLFFGWKLHGNNVNDLFTSHFITLLIIWLGPWAGMMNTVIGYLSRQDSAVLPAQDYALHRMRNIFP